MNTRRKVIQRLKKDALARADLYRPPSAMDDPSHFSAVNLCEELWDDRDHWQSLATLLADALTDIKGRLEAGSYSLTCAEAYDSFYQEIVDAALSAFNTAKGD